MKISKLAKTIYRAITRPLSAKKRNWLNPGTAIPSRNAVPESLSEFLAKGNGAKLDNPPLFAFYFDDRKSYLKKWFPEKTLLLMGMRVDKGMFEKNFKSLLLSNPDSEILSWGYRADKWVYDFANEHCIPLTYCEDGFIRSTGLGNERQQPLSLCFDRQGIYFDARSPSDLETLLSLYDFQRDATLMERAAVCREKLLSLGLSKYNFASPQDIDNIYGPKSGKRILVLGQVETDASIKYGCEKKINNNDAVRLARAENPDAQIIYKPHPDVLHGGKLQVSDPQEVADIATVVYESIPFAQALETIDHVYTITSLGGFEALLRGITVTTLGCPFYSGWGLTDDRQPNPRRKRNLTIDQLFAGAYILYPWYFHPLDNRRIELEEALEVMAQLKAGRDAGIDATPSALMGIALPNVVAASVTT
ncbi:capsular polysaccharide export protein, LipB/KpsS family [Rhizobium herbae]|uniref:Capsular polysaccharide export protein n=1 Tax=Rhizobium herbae TaxID=508661 RepID=A0ABS4ET32_9HYPH|nr:capsular polysaccharide biosynthesis protein [Rhizobium herbae]MBP1861109.1 capsular polysaccharide export protein [Rhizobium herbae]